MNPEKPTQKYRMTKLPKYLNTKNYKDSEIQKCGKALKSPSVNRNAEMMGLVMDKEPRTTNTENDQNTQMPKNRMKKLRNIEM